jgi:hypothetical protein
MKIVVRNRMHTILKSALWVAPGRQSQMQQTRTNCGRRYSDGTDSRANRWNASISDSAQLVKKTIEPIILSSQELDIGPSPEAAEFSPRPNNRILEDPFY